MNCRFCNNFIKKPFLTFKNQPLANELRNTLKNKSKTYNLKVYFCKNCFYVQAEEAVKPRKIFSNDYPYQSSVSKTFLKHAKNYSNELITNFKLNKKNFVLEIACNDGYMLNNFKEKKIPHLGIEPTGLAEISKKKGINVIKRFFNYKLAKELEKKISVDLIIANNVLAHVPNINDFIKGIKTLLKKNGFAVFEFPHLLNILKKNLFDTIYHEHYSYLSVIFLKKLFESNNLKIFMIKKKQIHGGSLRVFCSHHDSNFAISPSVNNLIRLEKKHGLDNENIFFNFSKQLSQYKILVNKKINLLIMKGKIICGYGAAAKTSILLNYLNLDFPTIKCVYDKSPSKHDKFIPGKNILIKSLNDLKTDSFDYLIIFPWNLKKEIVKDVLKLKNKKIKFITLVPTYKIFAN